MDQTDQEPKKSQAIPPWILIVVAIIGIGLLVAYLSNPEGVKRTLAGESQFTIRLSGTPGLKFNGVYAATLSNGSSTSQSVEGIIPTEYTVTAKVVSITFSKEAVRGTLHVDILKENSVIKSAETSTNYGNVMIVTD
jgi:hypothetical protein